MANNSFSIACTFSLKNPPSNCVHYLEGNFVSYIGDNIIEIYFIASNSLSVAAYVVSQSNYTLSTRESGTNFLSNNSRNEACTFKFMFENILWKKLLNILKIFFGN